MKRLVYLLIGLLRFLPDTQAQSKPDTVALNQLYDEFAPAEHLAPTLLGVGLSQVSKPSTVHDISLNVLQSFVNLPNSGSGVGLEFSPYSLLRQVRVQPPGTIVRGALARNPISLQTVLKPYYESIDTYRKGGGWRDFTLSGASVGDSASSQLAFAVGYTFGAGQLDPLRAHNADGSDYAKGLLDKARAAVKTNLDSLNSLEERFTKQSGTCIAGALRTAQLPLAGDTRRSGQAVQELFNNVFALPNVTTGSSLDSLAPNVDTLRTRVRAGLEKIARDRERTPLTDQQRATLETQAISCLYPLLQNVYTMRHRVLRPYFTNLGKQLKEANDEFDKRNWNAPLLQLGVGQTWRSPDHTWGALTRRSVNGVARLSTRLAHRSWGTDNAPKVQQWLYYHSQLVLNAQYSRFDADSLRRRLWYGTRLLLGNEHLRFSAEYSWQRRLVQTEDNTTPTADNTRRWTIGAEVKVADNLWLEAAIGAQSPTTGTQKAQILTLADLKYGFRKKRRFTTH